MASARSSSRRVIWFTLTPAAGSNSYIVTTGPGWTSVTRPVMPKSASLATSRFASVVRSAAVIRSSCCAGMAEQAERRERLGAALAAGRRAPAGLAGLAGSAFFELGPAQRQRASAPCRPRSAAVRAARRRCIASFGTRPRRRRHDRARTRRLRDAARAVFGLRRALGCAASVSARASRQRVQLAASRASRRDGGAAQQRGRSSGSPSSLAASTRHAEQRARHDPRADAAERRAQRERGREAPAAGPRPATRVRRDRTACRSRTPAARRSPSAARAPAGGCAADSRPTPREQRHAERGRPERPHQRHRRAPRRPDRTRWPRSTARRTAAAVPRWRGSRGSAPRRRRAAARADGVVVVEIVAGTGGRASRP